MEHATFLRESARTLSLGLIIMALSACLEEEDEQTDLTASDSGRAARINVRNTPEARRNAPPRIAGTPAFEAVAGVTYAFQPFASDADGDRLGFSISNQPVWADFDPDNGRLSGRPQDKDLGKTKPITISVSDGKEGAKLPAFTILVTDTPSVTVNSPPVLSGTPSTSATVNELYVFQPTATDPDGDKIPPG